MDGARIISDGDVSETSAWDGSGPLLKRPPKILLSARMPQVPHAVKTAASARTVWGVAL